MKEDFYIYVSSTDFETIDICLPHETAKGKWQIGLCEISFSKSKTSFPSLDICCNIIAPNFQNNRSSQILRRIPPGKGKIMLLFNPILYCNVLTPRMRTLQLYLKTDENDFSPFKEITLYCTLHCVRHE